VNQTWWLESELEAHRGIWDRPYPEPPLSSAISPDPAALLKAHERGEDPYRAPTGKLTRREKRELQSRTGGHDGTDGQGSGATSADNMNGVEGVASGYTSVPLIDGAAFEALKSAQMGGQGGVLYFLMFEPSGCGATCEKMGVFWRMVADNFSPSVRTVRVDCKVGDIRTPLTIAPNKFDLLVPALDSGACDRDKSPFCTGPVDVCVARSLLVDAHDIQYVAKQGGLDSKPIRFTHVSALCRLHRMHAARLQSTSTLRRRHPCLQCGRLATWSNCIQGRRSQSRLQSS
jgi:hypothetical protein